MLFTEHDEMVQALGLDRLNPAFDVGADVGRLDRTAANFDALGPERIVERPAKLSIAIPRGEEEKIAAKQAPRPDEKEPSYKAKPLTAWLKRFEES